jgi:hypothetical protein
MQIPTHSAHIKTVNSAGWNLILINKLFTANFNLSERFYFLQFLYTSVYNYYEVSVNNTHTIFILRMFQQVQQ